MSIIHSTKQALQLMKYDTGIVIPVYFPEGVDSDQGQTLLRDTVLMFREQVVDSTNICLSVDGEHHGTEIAKEFVREFKLSFCVSPVNRGKLQGAVYGVRYLLEQKPLQYFAVVDQDGDHFANELLNFLRAAHHISTHIHTDDILIVGRRISRHRPMGFPRGEIEELADRVLLDGHGSKNEVLG